MAYGAILGQTPIASNVSISQTTAETVWPDASTRPENPNVDEALEALAEKNDYDIGDIKTTVRTDLGDKWLLCNGENVNTEEYPNLVPILPASRQSNTKRYNGLVNPNSNIPSRICIAKDIILTSTCYYTSSNKKMVLRGFDRETRDELSYSIDTEITENSITGLIFDNNQNVYIATTGDSYILLKGETGNNWVAININTSETTGLRFICDLFDLDGTIYLLCLNNDRNIVTLFKIDSYNINTKEVNVSSVLIGNTATTQYSCVQYVNGYIFAKEGYRSGSPVTYSYAKYEDGTFSSFTTVSVTVSGNLNVWEALRNANEIKFIDGRYLVHSRTFNSSSEVGSLMTGDIPNFTDAITDIDVGATDQYLIDYVRIETPKPAIIALVYDTDSANRLYIAYTEADILDVDNWENFGTTLPTSYSYVQPMVSNNTPYYGEAIFGCVESGSSYYTNFIFLIVSSSLPTISTEGAYVYIKGKD